MAVQPALMVPEAQSVQPVISDTDSTLASSSASPARASTAVWLAMNRSARIAIQATSSIRASANSARLLLTAWPALLPTIAQLACQAPSYPRLSLATSVSRTATTVDRRLLALPVLREPSRLLKTESIPADRVRLPLHIAQLARATLSAQSVRSTTN